jgi:hypothetical protein
LGREGRTRRQRAGDEGDGVSSIRVIALNGERDALSNESGERGSTSGGGGTNPHWGVVGGNNVGELHQEIDHDSALSTIGDDDGSGVETISKSSVVPAVETSGGNGGSRRLAGSIPVSIGSETVSEGITIRVSCSNLEAIRACSGDGSNGKNVRNWGVIGYAQVDEGEHSFTVVGIVSKSGNSAAATPRGSVSSVGGISVEESAFSDGVILSQIDNGNSNGKGSALTITPGQGSFSHLTSNINSKSGSSPCLANNVTSIGTTYARPTPSTKTVV